MIMTTLHAHRDPPGRGHAIALAILAVLLVWQVISRSLVAYLVDAAPQTALRIRATEPGALLNLADQRLNGDGVNLAQSGPPAVGQVALGADPLSEYATDRIGSWAKSATKAAEAAAHESGASGRTPTEALGTNPQTIDEIRVQVEQALVNDPLNARALRILGQLADRAADGARAKRLMAAAARRSIRESAALSWLMRKSLEHRDYHAAISYSDTLLRTRSRARAPMMPVLAQLAQNQEAIAPLKTLLAAGPPWRAQFFSALAKRITDARTPLDLLLSLKDTPYPPTSADLRGYLNVLVQRKLYDLAYYTWLQSLPAGQLSTTGYLVNGSFEQAPSGLPFDWELNGGEGVTLEIAARSDQEGRHALLIEFGHGRIAFRGPRQLVVLGPGSYRLKGQHRGEIIGRRGLKWRVVCAGEGAQIGESEMLVGAASMWKAFEVSFTVPDRDCRAQYVRLDLDARSASERLVAGSIWHDELQISRL